VWAHQWDILQPEHHLCVTGVCQLDVNVTSCAPDGSGITADTEPDPLHVCSPRRIRWKVKGQDEVGNRYKFASNGIEFVPSDDFDPTYKEPNDYTFVWVNKHVHPATNEPPKTYKYSISINKPDGTFCAKRDPLVSNE
jgi:hypothetical protein